MTFYMLCPIWGSSRIVKDEFWDGLDSFLGSSGEQWIVLCDFNARVGSKVYFDDQWTGVRGFYGIGDLNDAGRELLSAMKVQCATPGFRRKIFMSRLGNTQSLVHGIALTTF